MQTFRTRVIGLGASALVCAGGAAGVTATRASAAAPSVVTVVKAQEKKVVPDLAVLRHLKIKTPADASRYVPRLTTLATDFTQAATAVGKASATSATQRTGQREWVAAAKGTARGFTQFAVALKALAAGHATAATREIKTAQATVSKATALGKKADKLLGVSSS